MDASKQREREKERDRDRQTDRLTDRHTLFLNDEDIRTKADSHYICRCYSTANNQNIHSVNYNRRI